MSFSLTYNATGYSAYGLIVESHNISLARESDSLQLPDRSWAGKGQAVPAIITLNVAIVGTDKANLLSRLSTIRGLLDQEEECALALDLYTDRYWMAKFSSIEGDFVSVPGGLWKGTIIFTCHDGKAYANAATTLTFTLTDSISASYGGDIYALAVDALYVYAGGSTTKKVYKLDKVDLTKIAESASYGGNIVSIAIDATHVYVGGYTTEKVRKLLITDLSFVADGPAYGGTIHGIAESENYIYYGGANAAGAHLDKLLKSNMSTIVHSANHYGGTINAVVANSTHVFYGGATLQKVRKTDMATMAVDVDSADYLGQIHGLAIDSTYVYCVGATAKILKILISTMATDTLSADLGNDLWVVAVDDESVYTSGSDYVVYKCDIVTLALVATSQTSYSDVVVGMAIDGTNLYIGGCSTRTVWKLDTRHLDVQWTSDLHNDVITDITSDDNYIYTFCSNTSKVWKIRKIDGVHVAESAPYRGAALANDADFIYCSDWDGATTWTLRKLSKSNLTLVATSANYGGTIKAVVVNSTHVFIAGETTQVVRKLLVSTLAWVADSANYGSYIKCLALSSTHVYAAGGLKKVRRHLITTMATVSTGPDYGSTINVLRVNSTHAVYAGLTKTVVALSLADMTTVSATSAAFSGYIYALQIDTSYVYVSSVSYGIAKLKLADLTPVAVSVFNIGLSPWALDIDDGYIYVSDSIVNAVLKCDKRVLWQRADAHLLTSVVLMALLVGGTSKTAPSFSLATTEDWFWRMTLENATTGDTLTCDFNSDSGDVLDIDGDIWYVELNGVSIMYGVSGDPLRFAAGLNDVVLYDVPNCALTVTYIERFA